MEWNVTGLLWGRDETRRDGNGTTFLGGEDTSSLMAVVHLAIRHALGEPPGSPRLTFASPKKTTSPIFHTIIPSYIADMSNIHIFTFLCQHLVAPACVIEMLPWKFSIIFSPFFTIFFSCYCCCFCRLIHLI